MWLLGACLTLGAPVWAGTTASGSTGDTGEPAEEPLVARGGGGCGDGLAWMWVAVPLGLALAFRSRQ